ncbi:MAG: hypothetical protein PHR35_20565 [Kiritimatiellae bacterium]|nr:hypothetical protein [Kiritimatiellia bacterium]
MKAHTATTQVPPPPDWEKFADLAQRVADFEARSGRSVEIARAIERDRMTRQTRERRLLHRMVRQPTPPDPPPPPVAPPAPAAPMKPEDWRALALWIAPAAVSTMLLVATDDDLDGSYYTLLRWVVFGVAVWLTIRLSEACKWGWMWTLMLVAGIFNPFFHVHMVRGLWVAVDLATIPLLLIATGLSGHNHSPAPSSVPAAPIRQPKTPSLTGATTLVPSSPQNPINPQ